MTAISANQLFDQLARIEDKTSRIEDKYARSEALLSRVEDKVENAANRMNESARQSDLAALRTEMRGLAERTRDRAAILSHGQRQWLEIGMLLMQEPELLLVDEPVAGMTDQETEHTAGLLRRIAGRRSVVVVEHDHNGNCSQVAGCLMGRTKVLLTQDWSTHKR